MLLCCKITVIRTNARPHINNKLSQIVNEQFGIALYRNGIAEGYKKQPKVGCAHPGFGLLSKILTN